MAKVLLLNSPIFNEKQLTKEDYLPPIGLGYIATNLEQNNIPVEILDAVHENLTIDEIVEILKQKQPNFVGVNIFSINQNLVKQIIENYKGDTTWLLGAKTVQSLYKEFPQYNTKNKIIGVIGEADLITADIINNNVKEKPSFSQGNTTIYSVGKNSFYYPHDISQLKLDRRLFADRVIKNPYGLQEDVLVGSRGCVYNCAFCGGARSLNKSVAPRVRNIESLKQEIIEIKKLNPQVECIRMLDDLFLRNRKSIEQAIELFTKSNLQWRAMAHINVFKGNLDLLERLKESGCVELEIGIESGNDKMREVIHKEGSVMDVKSVVGSLLDNGLNVKGYFMYGLPNETLQQATDSFVLANELHEYSQSTLGNFKTSAFQFRPYHGTELFANLGLNSNQEYKHIESQNDMIGRQQFNFMAENYSQCSQQEIDELVIKTNSLSKNRKNLTIPNRTKALKKCDVMMVGISNKDDEKGTMLEAFDGSTNSGKLIQQIETVNSNINIYKTNLVKFTPKDERGKIRYPLKEEIDSQIDLLLDEIKNKQPKIVLAMGNMVFDYLNAIKNQIDVPIEKVEHPSFVTIYRRKQIGEYIAKITQIINTYCNEQEKEQ
ncbi:MAG: radical SAM protein [Christensenellaceae bacterium]|jgi:radical SAM superfamily enzyme YgiQ (UPF0313 family)/uracil-DNA glycosylase|nr:radical SAM protein [Christensenellaceae bacterium]